jgi:hypothetical protein
MHITENWKKKRTTGKIEIGQGGKYHEFVSEIWDYKLV